MKALQWKTGWQLMLALMLLLIAGCKEARQVEMKLSLPADAQTADIDAPLLPDGNFFSNGFPTDLRVAADGKVDIADFPRRIHLLTNAYVRAIRGHITGYSPLLPIYLPFSAPILVEQLPTDERAYVATDAPIQLVDVDADSPEFGRRFPLTVTMTQTADQYRPAHLLQVLPLLGMNLRANTTYALVVTDRVPVADDKILVQHPQLQALLNPAAATVAVPERAVQVFAPLRQWLAVSAIDPATIIGATVWTTADMTTRLRNSAQQVATLPVTPARDLHLETEYDHYCVIAGTVDVPGFQRGTVPYLLNGGRILFDDNDAATVQYTRAAKFVVTIPKHTPMPASGFPLLNYHHGAGGVAAQVYMRGEYLYTGHDTLLPSPVLNYGNGPASVAAERGWASAGLAAHLGSDHFLPELSSVGLFGYNPFNPLAFKYNYYQLVLEQIYFRRVLDQLQVDADLCPDAVAPQDGRFRIDPALQVSMGQSQGNWVSALQVATDPRPYQGAIFSGIAATWLLMFIDTPDKQFGFESLVATLMPGTHLDQYHPFLALLQWMASDVDPLLYMDELYRYPQRPAPHSFTVSGIDDVGSPEMTQRTFMTALGVDVAGDEVGTTPDTDVLGHLQKTGARQLPYPVSANRLLPEQEPRTAVVVRYENTVRPTRNRGHHVTHDLPAPRHQYGCFLQNLAEGRTPVIIAGEQQGGPCL